jgi:hypothetical protein
LWLSQIRDAFPSSQKAKLAEELRQRFNPVEPRFVNLLQAIVPDESFSDDSDLDLQDLPSSATWHQSSLLHNSSEGSNCNDHKDFGVVRRPGKGGFGHAHHAVHPQTEARIALKAISLRDLNPDKLRMLRREISLHLLIKNLNVITLMAFFCHKMRLFHVLERASGGAASPKVRSLSGKKKETTAVGIVSQATKALSHLHSIKVIHHDLKPENMLMGGPTAVRTLNH